MLMHLFTDCKLSLNKPSDFSSPQPVFLQDGEFLAPKEGAAILVKHSETIIVSCSGVNRFIVLGNNTTALNTAVSTIFQVKSLKLIVVINYLYGPNLA